MRNIVVKYGIAALLGVLSAAGIQAQFSIDWYTIDGGGGTTGGGVYSLSGTIGQPDAGETMTGGSFALTGGFWAIAAVQTPGAPTLMIVPASPGQATISWDPDSPGFVLQQTTDLPLDAWTNSPSGSTNPVTVPTAPSTTYYRLRKP